MKLHRFVILLGVLVVARAADQCPIPRVVPSPQTNCMNNIRDDICEDYKEFPGCVDLSIRQNCRKTCNACDSYEQFRPRGDRAILYGGNHILTWDRLRFDCTAMGEFILYSNRLRLESNEILDMKVHALFTRPTNARNPVTTAVAASVDSPDRLKHKLQIAVNRTAIADNGRYDVGNCEEHLIFWVGDETKTVEQVRKVGGFGGISVLNRNAENIVYKMDLRSEARARVSLRYSKKHGCHFSQVQVLITTEQRQNATGLLGTPDNMIDNEWHSRDGTKVEIPPNRISRYLEPAYDYCTTYWCVRNEAGSTINYTGIGSFSDNSKCDAEYNGFESNDFFSVPEETSKVCGKFNFECLQDSLSTNSVSEGIQTIKNMAEVEIDTVPDLKDGLTAQPRGIRAGRSWTITILLKSNSTEPELNGFGLYELDEDTLERTQRVVAFLSDDGVNVKGDAEQFDRIYSDKVLVKLSNSASKGYVAVPLINGRYEFERKDLTYTLPNAVRGYSVESGRAETADGNSVRKIFISRLADKAIEVRFEGPEDQEAIIGGARFLDFYTGDAECGDLYDNDYLDCLHCEAGEPGEITKLLFRVGRARRRGIFDQTASLLLEGFFFGSNWSIATEEREPVPVKITAVVKANGQELRSLSIDVLAGEKILSFDQNLSYCTDFFPDSLLAELKIRRTPKGWELSLSESHVV